MNSAKNRTDLVQIRTESLICRNCLKQLGFFKIEEIDGIEQLRCGNALIPNTELICMDCGETFYWHIRDKDLKIMALEYSRLSANATYRPE